MDIAIDGMALALEQGTGITTYARNLSVAVKALGHQVHVIYGKNLPSKASLRINDDISFFDTLTERQGKVARALEPFRRAFLPLSGELQVRQLHFSGFADYRQFSGRMPAFDYLHNGRNLFLHAHKRFRWLRRFLSISGLNNVRIMHWTYPIPARLVGAKNIYTLHDLIPLKLPHTTLDDKPFYLALVRAIAETADLIVTDSENSRQDILSLTGILPERVVSIYQAVDIPEHLMQMTDDVISTALNGTFNLDMGGYFLFLGAIEPRKNIYRLIEAYLASGLKYPLVIAGPIAWMADRELRMYQSLRDQRFRSAYRIRLLGYLSYFQLICLMRGALALTFPSLYEGFGLPVIEAMSVGCPVITSNVSSLPEICGEAAHYVNPYHTAEIREAFRLVAEDRELREQLRLKGFEQARRFSQEAYQSRLQAMYERLM